MAIRLATQDDIGSICSIENETLPEQWGASGYQSHLNHQGLLLISEDESSAQGFLAAKNLGDTWELYKIAVVPHKQRRGVATALLTYFLDNFGQSLLLEVRESNIIAQAFYSALGFKENGRRAGYYSDGEAALLFQI